MFFVKISLGLLYFPKIITVSVRSVIYVPPPTAQRETIMLAAHVHSMYFPSKM